MPRLDPIVAAKYAHIQPQVAREFSQKMAAGVPTLEAITDFAAACYGRGVPSNALISPEGDKLVARWTVPMPDYPRNR
jgi:hypothetical protein